MTSYRDDWRDRHGPRRSGGRVIIYIVLLAVILLLMSKAGDISKQFTDIFLAPSGESAE